MMKIPNPRGESLQQLLPLVQERFPGATIRKIFLSPEAIFVPHGNFKFVVRRRKERLLVDHTLPALYAIGAVLISIVLVSVIMSLIFGRFMFGIGGALWIVLGIFIMKTLFQSLKKAEFETFRNELTTIVSGFDFDKRYATPAAPDTTF